MTVYVALLTGVNVGGHHKLPMADLRRIAEACGLANPRTYIQSGNLVFDAPRTDRAALAAELRAAIHAEVGFDTAVVIRNAAELVDVITANPFLPAADPAFLHVLFRDPPGPTTVLDSLDLASYTPDVVAVRTAEMYFHLPHGLGRSKLVVDVQRLKTGARGTMRNWRTVTTLHQMTHRG